MSRKAVSCAAVLLPLFCGPIAWPHIAKGDAAPVICDGEADFDGDGDTDLIDYQDLADCMSGPASSNGECAVTDLDGDGDTDLSDFSRFQATFGHGPLPSVLSVVLVNDGDFDVEVSLVHIDDAAAPPEVLFEFGTWINLTIHPGGSVGINGNCEDWQAMAIEKAELRYIGGVGPEASTEVMRIRGDYCCGNTITFTFDHSEAISDFHITVAIE